MKKSMIAALVGLSVGVGLVNSSQATEERSWAWSPLGVGIAAPLQLPFTDTDICGLRLGGFFGWNADVFGVDAGVAELTTGDFAGLQLAAFSWTCGNAYGVQAAPVANVVGGNVFGVDASFVNVTHGDFWGLQFGGVNYANSTFGVQFGGAINWNSSVSAGWQTAVANADQDEFTGFSLGVVNLARTFTGFDLGFVNLADDMMGCQMGVFNACNRMHGVQIGLLNLITESPRLPVMVIANAWF